ncbi:MAG: hypothetical protein QNL62_06725 [Gammaproteobacteria bacterium]|nr:hypothetical protein [Gammaproteobacteria bacterium]
MSLDLPLRLAIVEKDDKTWLLYQTTDDFTANYDVEGHHVLEKVTGLFSALVS